MVLPEDFPFADLPQRQMTFNSLLRFANFLAKTRTCFFQVVVWFIHELRVLGGGLLLIMQKSLTLAGCVGVYVVKQLQRHRKA